MWVELKGCENFDSELRATPFPAGSCGFSVPLTFLLATESKSPTQGQHVWEDLWMAFFKGA